MEYQWLVYAGLLLNCLMSFATAAIAVFTWQSAKAAERAAQETHLGVQSQIVSSLLDDYDSEEMRKAINGLKRWDKEYGERSLEEFRLQRQNGTDEADSLDSARRLLSHYYQKVMMLKKLGLVDDDVIYQVANREQLIFYDKVVAPLEKAVNPNSRPEEVRVYLGQ